MNRACAGFGAEVGHATRKLSPFSAKIASLHFEFLNGILRRNQDRQVDVANVQRLAIEVLRALVSEGTVHLIISPTKRIHSHGSACGTSLWNYRSSQFDQIKYVAAI